MDVIRDLAACPAGGEAHAVTIGAYDGVHVGHQAVMAELRRLAAERGVRTAVVTFDVHPATVVRPESAPKLLTDLEQKLELLAAQGIDTAVVVHFDAERAAESPEDFVQEVLVDCLRARVVVVGEDFHFGARRRGNVALLRALGAQHGFDALGLGLLPRPDGVEEPVSSTAIRRALAAGDVEAAARMLGRPHELRGVVVDGDHRGRELGFPTANVPIANAICLPADGVYAGWYERPNGEVHRTAISLGRRPTFYEDADVSLLEAYLLDFSGDLYGEPARVRFTNFLRGQERYDSVDALIAQMRRDVDTARRLLAA